MQLILKILIIIFITSNAISENNEKFLMLKNDKVNVRYGPSFDYPIKYIYKKINLPVKVIDKKENFRRIIDNKKNGGWIHISQLKQSKSFITDALDKEGNLLTPDAIEIWYGFYNKKDIEIRFYTDHSKANTSGIESAEAAVGRAVNANSKGGIITSTNNRVSYQSYVVAGNAVILCQDLLNNCKDLADKLE